MVALDFDKVDHNKNWEDKVDTAPITFTSQVGLLRSHLALSMQALSVPPKKFMPHSGYLIRSPPPNPKQPRKQRLAQPYQPSTISTYIIILSFYTHSRL